MPAPDQFRSFPSSARLTHRRPRPRLRQFHARLCLGLWTSTSPRGGGHRLRPGSRPHTRRSARPSDPAPPVRLRPGRTPGCRPAEPEPEDPPRSPSRTSARGAPLTGAGSAMGPHSPTRPRTGLRPSQASRLPAAPSLRRQLPHSRSPPTCRPSPGAVHAGTRGRSAPQRPLRPGGASAVRRGSPRLADRRQSQAAAARG